METNHIALSGFADEIDPMLDRQLEALGKLGMHYIEMRGVDGKNLVRCTDGEIRQIRSRLEAAQVRLSSIGSPIGKIGIEEDFGPHFDLFRRTVEIAKLLEAPYIRMFSFYTPEGRDPDLWKDAVLQRLSPMVDYARDQGVVLLHENEKGIFGDTAPRCRALMDALGCSHFRVVFDFANFVQCGQDTWQAYRLLKPWIAYVHIKDALASDGSVVPPGQGDGQLERILADLLGSGYQGFLSLEPHLSDLTGFGALEKAENQPWRALSGQDAFALARDSLLTILSGF